MSINKLGLLAAVTTLHFTQSVSFAQDLSPSNASATTYSIKGVAWTSELSGSFTAKNLNNDEFIDQSELSSFNFTFNYENTKLSCTLPALTKFRISASQLHSLSFKGKPFPASLLNLEITCQSRNAELSLSGAQLRWKIKKSENSSQTEQNTNSMGMQITYLTGISSEKTEFNIPVYRLQFKKSNQIAAQTSDIERAYLNQSFILTGGKTVKIYTKTWPGWVTGYKISMLNYTNNQAQIKIDKFEEYPRTLSETVKKHTISLPEANMITPLSLIIGDGYSLNFISFPRLGDVELKVVNVREM